MADLFTKVPHAALPFFAKLTKRQDKVLRALWSCRGKSATVHPSRETLAERSGIYIGHISRTTRELAELGLLTKEGAGGKSKATHYTLQEPWKEGKEPQTRTKTERVSTPQTRTKTERVSTPQTRTKTERVSEPAPDTPNPLQIGAQTRSKTERGKEVDKEEDNSRSGVVHQDFTKDSGEGECAHRVEKFAPHQAAAEPTEPTQPSQPEPPPPPTPAPEPMPWEQQEDDDDVPPWEREQPQPPANLRSKPEELPAKPEELPAKPEEREQLTLLPAPAEKPKKQKPLTQKQARKRGLVCAVPMPAEVDPQHWHDWLAYRQKKGKPVTLSAWQGFLRDAEICKFTVARAVQVCAEKCWLSLPVDKYTQPQNGWQQTGAQYKSAAQPARHNLSFDEKKEIGNTLDVMEWHGDISGDDAIVVHRLMEEGMLRMSVFKMFTAKHIDFQQLLKECGAAPQTLQITA